jgi:hypothetical protein
MVSSAPRTLCDRCRVGERSTAMPPLHLAGKMATNRMVAPASRLRILRDVATQGRSDKMERATVILASAYSTRP